MRRYSAAMLVILVLAAALATADLVSDLAAGTTVNHVLAEAGVLVVVCIGAALSAHRLVTQTRAARADVGSLARALRLKAADAERWRSQAQVFMTGLGEAIDAQFARWALTPAERQVALLLLKGLSHKAIASVRNVTEATTRQQARTVYRKSELAGRHDLAAFFLEDLMLPSAAEDERPKPA